MKKHPLYWILLVAILVLILLLVNKYQGKISKNPWQSQLGNQQPPPPPPAPAPPPPVKK